MKLLFGQMSNYFWSPENGDYVQKHFCHPFELKVRICNSWLFDLNSTVVVYGGNITQTVSSCKYSQT